MAQSPNELKGAGDILRRERQKQILQRIANLEETGELRGALAETNIELREKRWTDWLQKNAPRGISVDWIRAFDEETSALPNEAKNQKTQPSSPFSFLGRQQRQQLPNFPKVVKEY